MLEYPACSVSVSGPWLVKRAENNAAFFPFSRSDAQVCFHLTRVQMAWKFWCPLQLYSTMSRNALVALRNMMNFNSTVPYIKVWGSTKPWRQAFISGNFLGTDYSNRLPALRFIICLYHVIAIVLGIPSLQWCVRCSVFTSEARYKARQQKWPAII